MAVRTIFKTVQLVFLIPVLLWLLQAFKKRLFQMRLLPNFVGNHKYER